MFTQFTSKKTNKIVLTFPVPHTFTNWTNHQDLRLKDRLKKQMYEGFDTGNLPVLGVSGWCKNTKSCCPRGIPLRECEVVTPLSMEGQPIYARYLALCYADCRSSISARNNLSNRVWDLQIDINHIEPVLSRHFQCFFFIFHIFSTHTMTPSRHIQKWSLEPADFAGCQSRWRSLAAATFQTNTTYILKIIGEGSSFCAQLGSNWHIPGALNYTASACYICCWFNVTSYQGWICGGSEKKWCHGAPDLWHPSFQRLKSKIQHTELRTAKSSGSLLKHGTPFLRNLSWCLTWSLMEPKNKHKWPFPRRISCHLPDPLGGWGFPSQFPFVSLWFARTPFRTETIGFPRMIRMPNVIWGILQNHHVFQPMAWQHMLFSEHSFSKIKIEQKRPLIDLIEINDNITTFQFLWVCLCFTM